MILGSSRKAITLSIGMLVILAFVIASCFWVLSSHYKLLFSNLNPEEAQKITQKLDDLKIDYRLEEDGREIFVDEALVDKLRLKLLGDDFRFAEPVGFELFDKNDLGMTDFTQKINYKRALQGELERTIMSIEAVKSARVHIVMPESRLFMSDDNKTKAAVTLGLKPYKRLTTKEVSGITRLVAASVPELTPDQVTIIDQDGNILTTKSDQTDNIGDHLTETQALERYLTQKAQAILNGIFPNHTAFVRVNATLDFDQMKTTTQRYLPFDAKNNDHGVVSHIKELKKQDNPSQNVSTQNQDISSDIEYKVDNEVKQIISGAGDIKQLSVSVIIPDTVDEKTQQEIKALIANSVGLNKNRGDSISVAAVIDTAKAMAAVSEKPQVERQPAHGALIQTNATSKTTSPYNVFVSKIQNNPLWFVAGALIIIAFILIMLFWFISRRRLSAKKRYEMLMELKQWLQEPRA
ncbi:MAG: flagellar basal-body MS-ring/collar protein FliF [Francisellaceae bacterium]